MGFAVITAAVRFAGFEILNNLLCAGSGCLSHKVLQCLFWGCQPAGSSGEGVVTLKKSDVDSFFVHALVRLVSLVSQSPPKLCSL